MGLRPYQEKAVAAVREHWREWDRELLVMATGTGKTRTAKAIIEDRLHEGPVLFIAHRDELLQQAASTFGGAGMIKADVTDLREVTVGSIQTLARRPRYDFGTVVVDEAHHCVSESYRKVLDDYAGAKVLGLTATPDRKGLGDVFDGVAFEYGLRDAVRDGYLSPIVARTVPIDIDMTNVRIKAGDFEVNAVAETLRPYLPEIARAIRAFASDRKTLVFLPLVAIAQEFRDVLESEGVPAREVNGNSPDRAETLRWFKDGPKGIALCNAMLLCLDEETEILTKRGFVGIDEIDGTDEVANWNPDRTVFFDKPKRIVKRELEPSEYMVSVESRTINFRVTDRHKMVVSCGTDAVNWKKVDASDLGNRKKLPAWGISDPFDMEVRQEDRESTSHATASLAWKLRHQRRATGSAESLAMAREIENSNKSLHYKNPSELTLPECRLIGFWLADGSKNILSSGGVEYTLCQSTVYPNICNWIEEVLVDVGVDNIKRKRTGADNDYFIWSLPRGTGFGVQRRNGVYGIEPYLDKNGTSLFWGLNENQFDALVEGFWYGDGLHGKAENGFPDHLQLINTNKQLIDLFQAIGSVRGWRCDVTRVDYKNPKWKPQYRLTMRKGVDINMSCKTKINHEPYRPGTRVWCVTTTSGNIVTRRHGKVTVMGNCEGVDIPDCDCVVCLRPTKVRSLYSQIVGRGTRLAPGKENCLVLDFLWLSTRHDLCKPACLLTDNQADVDAVSAASQEDEIDVMEGLVDAVEQRRNALAAELAAKARRKARLIDPLSYFVDADEMAAADFVPEFAWQREPATEKQIRLIENAGIDPTDMCKGQASLVIDSIFRRREQGLATAKQVRMLRQKGFSDPSQWTFDQASKVMTMLANNKWRVPPWIDPATYRPQ